MYKSPIQILTEEPQFDIDGEICRCVQNMGIEVDKMELERALCYDRGQYEKGYNDRDAEIIRCKDCKHWGRKDVYKDGSAMIVCKQGRSIDADGFCHHAERREE